MVGSPADTDEIPGLLAQHLGKGDFIAGQRRRETRDARRDLRTSGQQRCARRHALGRSGEEAVELHALAREPVERRRFHIRVVVTTEERIAVIVRKQEQDIGPGRWRGLRVGRRGARHKQNGGGDGDDLLNGPVCHGVGVG